MVFVCLGLTKLIHFPLKRKCKGFLFGFVNSWLDSKKGIRPSSGIGSVQVDPCSLSMWIGSKFLRCFCPIFKSGSGSL